MDNQPIPAIDYSLCRGAEEMDVAGKGNGCEQQDSPAGSGGLL